MKAAGDPVGCLGVAEHQALHLSRRRSSQVPGQGADADHAEEEKRPDADRLVPAELADDDQVATEPDQERVQRRGPEEGGNLVERRPSDQVLVAVIEPRDLRHNEHQGQGEQGKGTECIVAQDRHADQDGNRGRGDVRQRKSAAVDRIAAIGGRPQMPLGDLLLRRMPWRS